MFVKLNGNIVNNKKNDFLKYIKKYLNNKILFKYNNMENNKVNYILNDSDDDDDDFIDEILENDKTSIINVDEIYKNN